MGRAWPGEDQAIGGADLTPSLSVVRNSKQCFSSGGRGVTQTSFRLDAMGGRSIFTPNDTSLIV